MSFLPTNMSNVQIQGLTEKVDNQRTNLERCMKEIETTKVSHHLDISVSVQCIYVLALPARGYLLSHVVMQDLWLPRLRDLVSRINETFSRNFMEMAVAGEVSLGTCLHSNYLAVAILLILTRASVDHHILFSLLLFSSSRNIL